MKTNKTHIIVMLFLAVLFSNCTKDIKFVGDEPDASTINLKINEIFSNSDNDPDWLEIYNPGDVEVDMTGFSIYDKVDAKFTWPAGTTIPAKGHLVLICDKDLATATPLEYANFKLSSGGESVTLLDDEDNLVDQVDFPALDLETTYARVPDGTDNWGVANATQGTANSNENNAPSITADSINNVNDNERFTYNIVVTDPSGILDVKLFYKTSTETQFVSMAPLGGGEYTYTFPLFDAGEVVEYYVEATDVTYLKTYFGGDSPSDNLEFTVSDGLPIFLEVSHTNATPGDEVDFSVKLYDKSGIDEVKLYYIVNSTDAGDKEKFVLATTDGINFTGTVPAQADGSVVGYYLRAEDNNGTKGYYPLEVDGEFDHDDGATWPTYAYLAFDPVTFTTVNYTDGPLTSLVFPDNPLATEANIVLTYDNTIDGDIEEARIYFDVRETPAYVKANKVKGEDDASFTQSGVTISFVDIDAEDESGAYSGNTSIPGTTVTFYVRIVTASDKEYYYSNAGTMYLDDTNAGGTTDQSDAFKADPTLWNNYTVQTGH